MSLTINLNQSPYYDDYSETKDFHQILFRPGYAVQARELTQLQTILQKQAERLGLHLFKNGSRVYGGEITLDVSVKALKLELQHNGSDMDVSLFQNKYITGSSSQARAKVKVVQSRTSTDQPTLIIQLLSTAVFVDGETILAEDDSQIAATTVSLAGASGIQNAQTDSSIVSISEGAFFVSGFLVRNSSQTIVLDKYSNAPTYRIGLRINEELISSSADASLLDNAQGSFNFAAPGADRLKLSLNFEKIVPDLSQTPTPIEEASNERFIELLRIENGLKVEEIKYPVYSELEKTLARRTYDESGDYTVRPFNLQLSENINGNTVLVSAGLDPGKAYVKGFEFETISTQYLDIEKGRNVDTLEDYVVSSDYGNKLFLSKMNGVFNISEHEIVDLHCVNAYSANAQTNVPDALTIYNSTKIGTARIRSLDYETADLDSGNTSHFHSKYAAYVYDIRANNKISGTVSGESNNTIVYLPSNLTSNVSGAYVGAVLTVNTNNQGYTTSDTISISEYIADGTEHSAKCNTALSQNVLSNTTFTLSFKVDNIKSLVRAHSTVDRISNANDTFVVKTSSADIDRLSKYNRDPNGNVFITDTNRNSLVYKLPYSPIKSIPSNLSYTIKRRSLKLTGTNITYSDPTGGDVQPDSITSTSVAENFIVAVVDSNNAVDNNTGEAFSNGQVLSFATGTGRSISVSGSQIQISLNSSRDMTIEFIYSTKLSGTRRSKTLISGNTSFVQSPAVSNTEIGHVHITSPNVVPGQKDNLMISDVFNIVKVIDSQVPGQNVVEADLSNSAKDITDRYTLDTGQKDNYYDHSSIILKPGQRGPTGSILVIVDYFEPDSTGGYFTVDSYPTTGTYNGGSNTFSYSSIPSFVSPSTGEVVSLRDVIDFRPIRGNNNNDLGANTVNNINIDNTAFPSTQFTSGGGTPDPETTMTSSIEYYLSRIDKIVLTKDRNFSVIKGVDGLDPITPVDDEDSMTLYTLTIPAYTFNVSDIQTRYIDNKRYTMRDIGKLERRIENLEYYTSLSLLEKETASLDVSGEEQRDSLFNPIGSRFKNGILVDSFSGHSIGDAQNDGYVCSIDLSTKQLRPSFTSDCFKFEYSNVSSTNSVIKNNIVSLPYTTEQLITQPLVSEQQNVNEFGFVNYIGNLKLYPFSDVWYDTQNRPDVLVNIEGQNDGWKFSTNNYGHGTQWNDWSRIWSGKQVNDKPSTSVLNSGDALNSQNRSASLSDKSFYRLGIKKDNIPESIIKIIGNKVIDLSVVPFIREQEIYFTAKNMKPNQNVYTFFDGTNISIDTTPADVINVGSISNNELSFIEGEVVIQGSNTGIVLLTDKTSSNTATIQIRVVNGNTSSFETGTIIGLTSTTQGQISSYTKSTSTTQANTDNSGSVAGSFTINSGTFRTGDRLVRLTDNILNNLSSTTTVSEVSFRSQGVIENRENNIVSTRYPIVRREQLDSELIINSSINRNKNTSGWINPMAQTFFVNKSDHPNGVFLNSIDLFFYSKPTSTANKLPITIQIRPVQNRLPSSNQIIPFSEVTLLPDFVNDSVDTPDTSNNDFKTTFTFDAPIYLTPDEYAIVILTNSDDYVLHSARTGDIVAGTTRNVTSQPNVGLLFKSQNSGIWEPTNDRFICFNINRCKFDTTVTSNVVLQSHGTSLTGSTTNTYFDTFKFIPSYLKLVNTNVSFSYVTTNVSGVTSTSDTVILPDQNINLIERKMIEYSSNGDFTVYTQMSSSDDKLSPIIDIDRFNVVTVQNNIDNGQLSNDDIIIIDGGANYNSSVTAVVSGGGTTDIATLSLNVNASTGSIYSCVVTSGGSGYITTPTVTVSNTAVSNGSGAIIKIKGETDNDSGNLKCRYITRRVTLEDGFDAGDIKVILTAYKPQGSNILVYTKVINSEDPGLFDEKEYVLMEQETSTSLYSLNDNDFIELTFKSTNDTLQYVSDNVTYGKFKTFAIKICMLSNNTTNVPKIMDMRAIALDE